MKLILQYKYNFGLSFIIFFCFSPPVLAQLSGTLNIPGSYATITDAVNAVNAQGVGAGGVIFNVAPNYREKITSTISLSATGTASNQIVFQKNPAATGNNPLITAYTGGTGTPASSVQDGIWRLVGADYVTIDGIDVRDDSANTANPATMEYGYALYKASTVNGCQNVTIKNCVVTLSIINSAAGTAPMSDGSSGIIVMNALPNAATAALTPGTGGTNTSNNFYGNTIRNCNTGIALIGYAAPAPYTLADNDNDVGGSSASTGNTIMNFGGAAGAVTPAVAIRTLAQYQVNVSYNTVNNNDGNGTNHPNILRGIYINSATSAGSIITYNTITVNGGGTTQAITGIENAAGSTADGNTIRISNNSIVNSTYATATTGGFYGINNSGTPATLLINRNTISNNSSAATTTGFFYGILNSGKASTVAIDSNVFTGNTTAALTTGLFIGLYNSASAPVVSISANTLAGNTSNAVSGVCYAIYNSGTVVTSMNINANSIGTPGLPAISFTAANSGSQLLIYNTKGATTEALTVNNNNFYNVLYATAGTGTYTYISNTATTQSQAINGNTFTNMNVNTSGSITFISNNVPVPATGTQNVNGNLISGTFTKAAGGTVTFFTSSTASSATGSVINNNNNNFSNVTVTGSTAITGWINTDAGGSAKTIQNNTFSNWTAGTGAVTAMSVSITGTSNATTGNAIGNIAGAGSITGISTGAGNDNIFLNTINTLSTTGAFAVTGLSVSGGTVKNIYRNKIYDLLANNAGGTVNGILVSGSTGGVVTANIYNNLIGDLRAPATNAADAIRGISVTSTRTSSAIDVSFNTVYLNASSTGATFGTTGIYHAASSTATTAALTARNNIIANTSTPGGSGLTVAYRRSAATLANYASASGNNLFYAGTPAANRLLFYDGTSSDQILATYKARMGGADAQSVTEDLLTIPKFLSTSGSSPSFLHIDPSKATLAESGGAGIPNYTGDYDAQVRQGNNGYAGTGTDPDIGADEFNGIQALPLTGTVLVGTGQAYTSLTNAGGLFAGVNSLGLGGNVTVKITSDLAEDGSNILNEWVEDGAGNYQLTIQPDASLTRTIAGNVPAGLVRLSGTKRLTIDGSNGTSGSYLVFRNLNTAGSTGTALTFINGASNNTVSYCTLEAFANATNGVVLFGTSNAAAGNNNNTVSNCSINATTGGNTGNVAVYSSGTTGKENTGNTILNNAIFNFRDRGLDIPSTGSGAWVVQGNSFYNGDVAGAISYASGTTLHGIRIQGGAGYTIRGNYIGGNAPLAAGTSAAYTSTAGTLSFQGILLTTTGATPVSDIKSNVIASITVSSVPNSSSSAGNTFIGIETNGTGINTGGTAAGEGNLIGSNTSNGSILVITTTSSASNKSTVKGINCQSTGGVVSGNQVGGIDIKNIGSAPGPSTFSAIYINNAAPPALVSGNLVGSSGAGGAANSIRVPATSTSTTTTLVGISIGTSVTGTLQVSGNTVQNVAYQLTAASGSITAIAVAATGTAAVTVSGNTISTNTNNASTGGFYGISSSGSLATLTVSGNIISGNVSTAATTGFSFGIYTSGAPSSISVTGNTFSGNTTGALTSGGFVGIYNVATPATLAINGNSFSGNATTAATGAFYAIYNSGAVTTSISINSNNIGTGSSAAITFNAANSAIQYLINNTGGAATAALSISNNNFYNINYAVAGSGNDYLILNSAATLSQAINSNTFTNLSVNTSGNFTFISDNVVVPANGTQNINNNSISGTFAKRAGGTVTLFTSAAASPAGSVINNNSNNFSNITVTSTTVIAGWINSDAGSSAKTIQNNTFGNWTGGTGAVTVLTVNQTGTANSTASNAIFNIAGAGVVTAISTGAGNDNIYGNVINTLSSTGAAAVVAIAVSAGTTKNIYRNKIYDLSASNAGGTVNAILVSGGTTVNVYNNLIGDLRTPAAASTDAIRAVSVTSTTAPSTINLYYNTIYLNASSTGTNFGTTGVYHVVSATSTTAALNMRNNSITNTSTPRGTGSTVAFRRSGTALNNYASTSNNNLFFAGTPGAARLLYTDGTSPAQTLAAYRSLVSPRDASSLTEDLTAKFLSTSGSSSVFMHMNTAIANAVESGAVNISGYTDDFDGQIRAGNPGYSGTSSFPDIGADEIFGIENVPPVISYTLLDNTTSTANRTATDVTITDASGINITAGTKPRIYYKRFTDANAWIDNSSSSNGWKYAEAGNASSPFSFTINYSLLYGGAAVTAGTIQYFIIAQDLATIANVAINSGSFNASPSSVALTAAAFPVAGTINSYNIPFSGTFNVGAGEVFTSLTRADGLFSSVNGAGLMGNTIFNITSDLAEDGTNALNQWTESGAGNYRITIQPDGAALRTVSGNVAAGLIRLNGADRVTFNGNNGGGSFLDFRNTNTSGTGTAFTFLNGAANNAIRYCIAEAFTNGSNGVLLFGPSSVAGGNSGNTVSNCSINATVASGTGTTAIYSAGTAGNENANDTLSYNSIYNYRDRGLDIEAAGSAAWVIAGNSFFNGSVSGSISYGASAALHGIRVQGGAGYLIQNNYIGGNNALASGANSVYASTAGNLSYSGISVTTGSASPATFIEGNTIASISLSAAPQATNSTTFTGIEADGAGINIGGAAAGKGNTIGSGTANASIIITTTTSAAANTSVASGISCTSADGLITGNQIGGIDISSAGAAPASFSFQGIYVNNSTPPSQINGNTIGSAVKSGSIRVLAGSAATAPSFTGIRIGTAVNSIVQVNGNNIQNIANLSTLSSGSFTGINNSATLNGAQVGISSDTVQYISSAANAHAGSAVYAGIVSSSVSSIKNNLIGNISHASTGVNAQVIGISVQGAHADTIANNTVTTLSAASAKETPNAETAPPAASALVGVLNTATEAGQIISGNLVTGLSATSGAALNVAVTAIGISATVSGNVYGNRIASLSNAATGTGPAICGITAAGGSFNAYNNTIRVSNLANINGVKMYGIMHQAAANWNYFYNSVRVSGNAGGTALRSAAFVLPAAASFSARDNVFISTRTGTGASYAVSNLASPVSAWSSAASDYNDLYSTNPNTTCEWGDASPKTFAQWKTLSGGDAHSISKAVSFLTSTYDLQPDSITNCALNNTGIPITTPVAVNTDINLHARSGTGPDLGAYEFNYIGFAVTAGSDAPVCANDSLNLTADPHNALLPSFSWKSPANQPVSAAQNPSLTPLPGYYKVTVTDVNGCSMTDSTLVSINQLPTASIKAVTSICDSGSVTLNITVTGTGTISGTLSTGDNFSGTAPLITVPVSLLATTSFSITNLSDAGCAAAPENLTDTLTIFVTHKGDWLGYTSRWSDPANWCGGVLPTSSTDVAIPLGTAVMPVISDSASCRNLLIYAGDTLTITAAGSLNIAGTLTSNGIYRDNGLTNFNGTSGQQTVSGVSTFNNLTLGNTNGLLLTANCSIKGNLTLSAGVLNAGNFNVSVAGNWINNASAGGYAAGTGTAVFNGTAAQNIRGAYSTTFNNLTISNSGNTVSLGMNAGVGGNLLLASGTLDLGAFTLNRVTAGGTLTASNNTILRIGGVNSFPANYSTVTLVVASTVEYAGTNQAVAGQLYGNLLLSSAAGAAVKTMPATALAILGNLTSSPGAGTSVSYTASSNITVSGNVTIGASTAFSGGSYTHSIGGNWMNNGSFAGGSGTVVFTGPGTAVDGAGAQNFNNITVAASGISFSAATLSLTGNLATTGSGSFTQAAGRTLQMSGAGKTIGGTGIRLENLAVSGSVSAASSIEITGNLAVSGSFTATGSTVTLSGASRTMTGAGTRSFGLLSVTGSVTTDANFSVSSGVTVSGSLSASAGTATFTGSSTLSGTANLYDVTLNGTSLQLSVSSMLGVAHALTIASGVLDATSSGYNTVNFNGAGAQNVNGITYSRLVLSNGNTKTASGAITTVDDIITGSGTTFDPAAFTHTVYGNWVNNGTFITGSSSIRFMGAANSSVSGSTTFYTLTVNTANPATEITLQNNISAATVNMVNGTIVTGSNTITITGTRTGNGIILGNIQRTHAFTAGVAYAFEGPQNGIAFSSVSGVSSVTVSVVKGLIGDFPFGGSISRLYNISVPAGTYNATLRLHYNNDELNGNNELSVALWHYSNPSWGSSGRTANDTALNYAEQTGLTDITGRWTLSDDANLVQWNGSVSSDWNNAANWTVTQGGGSRPPSSSDIVNLGTGTFVNQPVITGNVTVKSIAFGSAQAVTLTLGGGGSLTTLGDISGAWAAGARHTISVNNQSLTANGSIMLSDGISGHAIDLAIGAGSVTTLGSLFQSGGAGIGFSGAGTLNIYKDFDYASGSFTAGSGTVAYNGSQNQNIAKVVYRNLLVNKASGLAAISDSVAITGNLMVSQGELDNYTPVSVAGNVTISAAGILNNHSKLYVQGDWNNNGTYTATGSQIIFNGAGTQSISASTFNNLEIRKPAAAVAMLTGDVVIKGNLVGTSGILDTKTFNFNRDVVGGTAIISDSATLIVGADNVPDKFAGYALTAGSTVVLNGTGTQHLQLPGIAYGNLTFRNQGLKMLYAPVTVNGKLSIDSNASLDGGAVTITLNGDWQNSGTFIPQSGTVLCNGANRYITGNTTFNRLTAAGSYTILNDVTFNGLLNITSTGSLTGGSTIRTTLNGDLINSGVLYTLGTTTYTGNVLQTLSLINAVTTVALTVNFNGSVSPLLNSTSAPEFGYLNINNTGGVNPSVGWTIRYAMTVGSGASFNGGGSTHNFMGALTNNGTITSSGVLNFMPASAAAVNLGSNFSSTGTVDFGGAGTLTVAGAPGSFRNVTISNTNRAGINPSSGWIITNDLTVSSSSILTAGSYSHQVGGSLSNSGTINSGTGTFILNGTGVQRISTTSSFNNLTIGKASGTTLLLSDVPVGGILAFAGGSIRTGSNVLALAPSGSVTGAGQNTGWVNGRLQKFIAAGNTAATFEIGDSVNYLPAAVTFTSVATAGNLIFSATAADHPNIGSAMINTYKSVNRYWTLTNNGIAFGKYAAMLAYRKADIDSGAVASSFGAGLYNGSSWSLLHTIAADTAGIRLADVTAAGDIAVGEVCNAGTAISYPDSVYCTNAGQALVMRTGNSTGVYSSTPGLFVDAATGSIDLASSTPGTYAVTYTVAATGGCPVYTAQAQVVVKAAPAATILYAGPYCANAGTAAVSFSGTRGGVFSSTAGLTIDTSSGSISPASSTPGIYIITYTVAAVTGCGRYQATTSVTITTPPSAAISYAGSPYCSNAGVAGVTLTGTAGGTFGSAAGLVINTATGSINTAASIPGTYTVQYSLAATGGCSRFIASASVTVSAAPSASISYTGNPFCNVAGTATATITGTGGGTFSSTPGLVINAASGDVNTGASMPGNYTVTYSVAPADGCGQFTTSANITLNMSGTWTGAVSNDWNTAENWQCNAVPAATSTVTIPGGLATYPVISTGTSAVRNLVIQQNASLTVLHAVLQIGGTITAGGTFDAREGAIEMNGTAAQVIPASAFAANTLENLKISNNAGVTLAGPLSLTDVLTVSAGSLASGGYLTLRSGATFNARVATITSSAQVPVSGNVTVERYIPGQRKYRLITSSVTSGSTALATGQEGRSIWGNWQNSASNATAGTGTFITGGSSADGFDQQTTNASLFTYDDTRRTFTGFTTANGRNTRYTPLKAGIAYFMFVYGDRTNTIFSSVPNSTVLSSTGVLTTGDQVYNRSSALPLNPDTGKYTLLGNPFASPVNWATLPKTGIENTYWGWDPNLGGTGGYLTVNTSGAIVLQAPYSSVTGLNQYIQPGQGFFVRTSGTSPQLIIREQDKVAYFNSGAFGTPITANTLPLVAINLQYPGAAGNILADGVLAAFDTSFSNKTGKEDAAKLGNGAESIAIREQAELLSIDARRMPQNNDTLFLNTAGLARPRYSLQIFTGQLESSGLSAILEDGYLHTAQPLVLTDTNTVVFDINPAVPASFAADRFRIVFRSSNIALPVTFLTTGAQQKNNAVQVDWEVNQQTGIVRYEIEKSGAGIIFFKAGEVAAGISNNRATYHWLDDNPLTGYNYYRVRAVQADGMPVVSRTVAVKIIAADWKVKVFPNPVSTPRIHIWSGRLEKGLYTLQIHNAQGQYVMYRMIDHPGGVLDQTILFSRMLPAGTYYLKLSDGKLENSQTFFVEY